MNRYLRILTVTAAGLGILTAGATAAPPEQRIRDVEADWALQEKVRPAGSGARVTARRRGNVTTANDSISVAIYLTLAIVLAS